MSDWTKEREAEIKARCESATPGPWLAGDPDDDDACVVWDGGEAQLGAIAHAALGDKDAAFIASARTDLPDALAEIERQRASHAETVTRLLRFEDALTRILSGGQPYDPETIAREALFGEEKS